ncbi:MAG: chromosomal replication initiator protein DnaA [Phycisphaerae bacterium]|nr:chromosomal replication initiator protein DnaA [Phycisphaerae bacterium]
MAMTGGLSDVVWADVLGHVRTHHPTIARGWFSQLQGGTLTNGELTVLATNEAQLSYLSEHCTRPFVEAAQAATGRLVSVRFATNDDVDGRGEARPVHRPPAEQAASLLPLNAAYVFEHFVVGPCNRLAHASCLAVSESPGTTYNPLFIHGNVGLGKTHLLQAVFHKVQERCPAAHILYLSCETFVNQFIEAVERGALDGFRYRYRHVDMLLIDDIQFLSGRDRTQEEFFHTFNTLYQLRRQIILSADCPPLQIPSLEERLVSRFNWGLVARIDPPALETRLAIIRKKTKMRGMELPEDVALFITSRVKSNTRELEGALNRVHGLAALDNGPINLALARRALGEEDAPRSCQARIQDIMGLVTERFNVKLSDLQGRRRSRSIALPRQVGMYLARQFTDHSLGEIGGFFGGRDHTTVLHANKLIASRRNKDIGLHSQLEEIETELRRS